MTESASLAAALPEWRPDMTAAQMAAWNERAKAVLDAIPLAVPLPEAGGLLPEATAPLPALPTLPAQPAQPAAAPLPAGCAVCGAPVPPRRVRYCSRGCAWAAEQRRRLERRGPCPGCGGTKHREAALCRGCREAEGWPGSATANLPRPEAGSASGRPEADASLIEPPHHRSGSGRCPECGGPKDGRAQRCLRCWEADVRGRRRLQVATGWRTGRASG